MFKIRKYKLKISDEHDALSPNCPISEGQEEKKRASWIEEKKQRQKEIELILYTNAQHLVHKMVHKNEIYHQIMKKINPAIIALAETRLTIDVEDYESGYSMVRCDDENRNTRDYICKKRY